MLASLLSALLSSFSIARSILVFHPRFFFASRLGNSFAIWPRSKRASLRLTFLFLFYSLFSYSLEFIGDGCSALAWQHTRTFAMWPRSKPASNKSRSAEAFRTRWVPGCIWPRPQPGSVASLIWPGFLSLVRAEAHMRFAKVFEFLFSTNFMEGCAKLPHFRKTFRKTEKKKKNKRK